MSAEPASEVVRRLASEPEAAVELVGQLPDETLYHLAAAIRDELRGRAMSAGDHDAIIEDAFDHAFGRDGLGSVPWVQDSLIVCPGAIVAKSRASHRCRFVSVDDVWIWESADLIREDKRSHPGRVEGFKAVALLPLVEGQSLDLVTGRARGGQHSVERVVSFQVSGGELVEVSQRAVNASGMH